MKRQRPFYHLRWGGGYGRRTRRADHADGRRRRSRRGNRCRRGSIRDGGCRGAQNRYAARRRAASGGSRHGWECVGNRRCRSADHIDARCRSIIPRRSEIDGNPTAIVGGLLPVMVMSVDRVCGDMFEMVALLVLAENGGGGGGGGGVIKRVGCHFTFCAALWLHFQPSPGGLQYYFDR